MLPSLPPAEIFRYFEAVSQIPRCSGNERAVSDYIESFALARGLEVIREAENPILESDNEDVRRMKKARRNNIIVKKPASEGYKSCETVALQGHLDMVCESVAGAHDFAHDAIKLIADEARGVIAADGTTLGADDGAAIAIMLAILNDPALRHPPLEMVFTAEEETGLYGARALDKSALRAKYLINIDSEQQGLFLASCAGGVRVRLTLDAQCEAPREGDIALAISLRGFAGGHSGSEIHVGRGNSILTLARLLFELQADIGFCLHSLSGGQQDNAIPREADALILARPGDQGRIRAYIQAFSQKIVDEYAGIEDAIQMQCTPSAETPGRVYTGACAQTIVQTLLSLPNGVYAMCADESMRHLVETSNNIGILRSDAEKVYITSALRSSVPSRKALLLQKFHAVAALAGATVTTSGDYPGWQYNPHSKLREVCCRAYQNITGTKAKVDGIHAGLECGLFVEGMPGLDAISLGPDIEGAHSPGESLSIASFAFTYELVKKILEELQ